MPLGITLNKTVHTVGDVTDLTATATGLTDLAKWESKTGGTFTPRIGSPTVFSPTNKTGLSVVELLDVRHPMLGNAQNVSFDAGAAFMQKSGGDPNAWDAGANGYSFAECAAGDCLIEAKAVTADKTKAIGLDFGAGTLNPADANWAFCLVATNAGTLLVYSFGTEVLQDETTNYVGGDILGVRIRDSRIEFIKNDVVFFTLIPSTLQYNIFPILAVKDANARWEEITWWDGNVAGKYASKGLQVRGGLPVQPQWSYEINTDEDVKMSLAEDRSAVFSVKADSYETVKMQYTEIEKKERDLLQEFFANHGKSEFWDWIHPDFGWKKAFRFDTPIQEVDVNADTFNLSFTITQNKEWETQIDDTTAPTVSVTAPTAGQTIGGNFDFTASATDDQAVARVQFQIDGVNAGVPILNAPFTYTQNTALLSNGSHTVRAIAYDFAENQKISNPISFTVSN